MAQQSGRSGCIGCLGLIVGFLVVAGVIAAIAGDDDSEDSAPAVARVPILIGMDLQDAQDRLQSVGFRDLSSEDALPGEDRFQIDDSNWYVVGQDPAPCRNVSTDTEVTLRVLKDDEDASALGVTVQDAPASCPTSAAASVALIDVAETVAQHLPFTEGPEDRSDRTAEFVNPGIQIGWASGTTAGGIVDIERYETPEARELAELDVMIENDQSQLGNTWASCKDVLIVLQTYSDPAQASADAELALQGLEEALGPC